MNKDFLINRLNDLLNLAEDLKEHAFREKESGLFTEHEHCVEKVDSIKMERFRLTSLSFIEKIYGKQNLYYSTFITSSKGCYLNNLLTSEVVLISIKEEIELGWLSELKDLVSANIFSDFLEMGKYFLDEQYKDAAAVIIGSVLEKHLKNLAEKNMIELSIEKNGKLIPKKVSVLNDELYKRNIYNKIDHQSIIQIFSIRNEAAHGNYGNYDQNKVDLMYQSVCQFLMRNI